MKFSEFFRALQIEPEDLDTKKKYMFVVTSHVWDLVFGGFVSKTIEKVSSKVGALSSELGKEVTGLWWEERISSP